MKVVILAGGRGTRLGADIPKPMVQIGGIPIIDHIMGIYRKYGFDDFIVATGYKGEIIRDYFKGRDNVTCLDTGLDAGTGERVRECALRIPDGRFLLTYGDGVADIDISNQTFACIPGHILVTAVHPSPRFGQMILDEESRVVQFNEKAKDQKEWINGGFFVVDTEIAARETGKSWEFDTLPKLTGMGLLDAYTHTGFWQCMDTQRDVDYLNQLWKDGAPWL